MSLVHYFTIVFSEWTIVPFALNFVNCPLQLVAYSSNDKFISRVQSRLSRMSAPFCRRNLIWCHRAGWIKISRYRITRAVQRHTPIGSRATNRRRRETYRSYYFASPNSKSRWTIGWQVMLINSWRISNRWAIRICRSSFAIPKWRD